MHKRLICIAFYLAFIGALPASRLDKTELLSREDSIQADAIVWDSTENFADAFEDLGSYIETQSDDASLPFLVQSTPYIMGALLLCLVFLMAFLPMMFIINVIANKRLTDDRLFIAELNVRLSPFLIGSDSSVIPSIKTPRFWHHKRLQRLLLEYANNVNRYFSGDISKNAIELYRHNVPSSDIRRILHRMSDQQRASFIRQGVLVPPRKASAEAMTPYLNAAHSSLRLWSRILYLRHFRDELMPLLANDRYGLSEFDKVVYCEFVLRSAAIGFEYLFEPLLSDHQNESVLIFALEMMILLKQRPEHCLLSFRVSENLKIQSLSETLSHQSHA